MTDTPGPAPLVGIIMGSRSDWETMRHAAETLTSSPSRTKPASSPPIAPRSGCSTTPVPPPGAACA